MRIRHALIAAVAVTSVAATTLPASATAATVVTHRIGPDGSTHVVGIGSAEATPRTDGYVDVFMSCQAVTAARVERTLVGCYIVGSVDGQGRYIDDASNGGSVVQTSHQYYMLPGQTYSMCINVGYDPEGPTGSTGWLGSVACNTLTV